MNRNSSIALFGAVFAVSVVFMGANGVFSMPSGITTTGTNYQEDAGKFLGHVTMVAQDPSGNIKAYRQMDNVVTNIGRTCTGAALFGTATTTGSPGCYPRGNFQYIGIGSNSQTETTTDQSLYGYIAGSAPQTRAIYTLTNSTDSPTTVGGVAVQTTSFLFSSSQTVGEADIQDSAGTSTSLEHAFARKAINPTISVNSGDTLTVTWTITTG